MIGYSCKSSNGFRRVILIIRFLLGNLKIISVPTGTDAQLFCFNLLCGINQKLIFTKFFENRKKEILRFVCANVRDRQVRKLCRP